MVAVKQEKQDRKAWLMDEIDRTDKLIAEVEAKRAAMVNRKAPVSGFIELQPYIDHEYRRREFLLWELKKAGGSEKEVFDRRKRAAHALD